jgi:hypothetical protein
MMAKELQTAYADEGVADCCRASVAAANYVGYETVMAQQYGRDYELEGVLSYERTENNR